MIARKADNNQTVIVDTLRRAGAFVCDLHAVGKGCVDVLVAYRGILYAVEIKDKRGYLTPQQIVWHKAILDIGHVKPVIIRSCLEAIDFLRDPVKFMEGN